MTLIIQVWLLLNVAVLTTAIFCVATFLRNPYVILGNYISIILLYILCTYLAGRHIRDPQQLKTFLWKNDSFHILIMTIGFLAGQVVPITWILAYGFSAFYQLISHIISRYPDDPNNKPIQFIRKIHFKLTNPPIARAVLVNFEVLTVFFIRHPKPINNWIIRIAYVVLILFFRYTNDQFHRNFWGQLKNQIIQYYPRLPGFVANILNSIIAYFDRMGILAYKLYQ